MAETYRESQRELVQKLRYAARPDQVQVTSVPIRADHAADRSRCLTSVIFVPAALAQDICHTLIAALQAIEPEHYYYSPAALHLTVKNIRIISDPPRFTDADVQKADRLFTELIPQHPMFSYALAELAAFTTSVSLIGYCDERLRTLVQALDAGLRAIGLPDDKELISRTVFFGNITLCRYARPPSERFLAAVQRLANADQGELPAQRIHLIACNAVCAPDTRTLINAYELQG